MLGKFFGRYFVATWKVEGLLLRFDQVKVHAIILQQRRVHWAFTVVTDANKSSFHLCQLSNFFLQKVMYKVLVLLHIARHSRKSSSHKVWLKLNKKEAWKLRRGNFGAKFRLNILVYLRKGDFPCEREKRIESFFIGIKISNGNAI